MFPQRLVRMPPKNEASMGTSVPCLEWEMVLHAFFDGELDAADSLVFEQHLGRCPGCSVEISSLKSIRRIFRRSVVGRFALAALSKSNWLVEHFDGYWL